MFAAEEEVSRLRKLEDDRFEAFEEENRISERQSREVEG